MCLLVSDSGKRFTGSKGPACTVWLHIVLGSKLIVELIHRVVADVLRSLADSDGWSRCVTIMRAAQQLLILSTSNDQALPSRGRLSLSEACRN